LEFYGKRKEHLTALLTEEWEILDNKVSFVVSFFILFIKSIGFKVRFIECVITDEVKVRGKAKKAVNDELVRCGFKKFAAKKKKATAGPSEDDVDGEVLFFFQTLGCLFLC
jgi:hypothetical protein